MSTRRRIEASRSSERGAALVEFALIAPLFVVLLFAMLHFGRAFNYWLDETHLANQGARWVVVNKILDGLNANCTSGGTDTSLALHLRCQAVTDELRDGQTDPGVAGPAGPMSVSICFPEGSSNVGDPVRVTVTTTWDWTSFLPLVDIIGDVIDTTTDLDAQATMRLEQVPTNYTGQAVACV